ncbi:hypothetical protein CP98_00141 [Sphingobium yanoikuyae]|uniref:Lysozyme inhibitor LprI-like N-terminal domain-containing protein n=1 Tax=Sphingobium yanoikuyae TaxID=13690 RepID=A0A084EU21_SPHYA|nr:lysozyme inhibitor LprI family protein [Sphingobium yanoikuyae]KEZ21463.1 hypothetical protein CP98_00141 [Sphingobium yanoikuyae]
MLIAMLLAGALPANPPEPSGGYDYDAMSEAQILSLDCYSVNLGADFDVGKCLWRQSGIWDARVDAEFAQAEQRSDPEMLGPLRKSQTLWLRYRKQACSLWDKSGLNPRFLGVKTGECRLGITRSRVDVLKAVIGTAN